MTTTNKEFVPPICGHTVFDETCITCQNMWDEYHGPMSEHDKDILAILQDQLDKAIADDTVEGNFEYYYAKTYRMLKRKKDLEDMN